MVEPGQDLGNAYDKAMQTKVFDPLGMTHTTFDFSKALSGNFASPHSEDVDGKTVLARMDMNYSMVPVRPAGGMWPSAHDRAKYLQMELTRGALPNGKRLVSAENRLERSRAQIETDEDAA